MTIIVTFKDRRLASSFAAEAWMSVASESSSIHAPQNCTRLTDLFRATKSSCLPKCLRLTFKANLIVMIIIIDIIAYDHHYKIANNPEEESL